MIPVVLNEWRISLRSNAAFCVDWIPGDVSLGRSGSGDAAMIWLSDFPLGFLISIHARSKQLSHEPLNTDRNIFRGDRRLIYLIIMFTFGLDSFEERK